MSNNLQLLSTIKSNNTLELTLAETEMPKPGPKEVLVRVEASPLNPSDQATLFGPADLSSLRATGSSSTPAVAADVPEAFMKLVATRIDKSLPTGSEGAGVVVAAGDDPKAQALLGKTVSMAAGAMYSQYRCVQSSQCMPMAEGVTPAQAASSFVNPLTALGFVETMRMEGHKALVNTAAASNLGIMLNRICQADGIDLVNIVRKPAQVEVLRSIGAKYVVDSSSKTFLKDLTEALAATGATIAFDAIGGGDLGSDILACMERVAASNMSFYDHYGSTVKKQLYIYGGLNLAPTTLKRGFGFSWSVGGWLLTNFIVKVGPDVVKKLQARVSAEITTTFATHYTAEISLREALDLDTMKAYSRKATGEKYLVNPQK